MRTDADQRVWTDNPARILDGQLFLPEVNAIGLREAGKVGPVVHDKEHVGLSRPASHLPRALQQLAVAQIFFA